MKSDLEEGKPFAYDRKRYPIAILVGHGYFKFGLGYSLGCLHLLPIDGDLGPQWSLGYNHGPSLCLITPDNNGIYLASPGL
jgi:hypothetical protein